MPPRGRGAPPGGFLAIPRSRAIRDGELKLDILDAPFKADMIKFVSVSGQVKSFTYDFISEPPHDRKMSQRCNTEIARQF